MEIIHLRNFNDSELPDHIQNGRVLKVILRDLVVCFIKLDHESVQDASFEELKELAKLEGSKVSKFLWKQLRLPEGDLKPEYIHYEYWKDGKLIQKNI